jgi:hypothetical protein
LHITSLEKDISLRREVTMHAIHRFQTSSVVIGAMLAIALSAPVMAQTEDDGVAMAPAVPSWDETSGYGSVEAIRAERAITAVLALPASVDPSRVTTARDALRSGRLGGVQEEAMAAIVAAATTWDDTSGYGSIEALRAARSLPVANQVPSDVRWAPASTAEDVARVGTNSPNDLSAALVSGQRAESAHLATVPLPSQAVSVNSEDRIANALFGPK